MPFVKGKSGNPGGRPKENDDVKQAAREYTLEAIQRLAAWMRSDNAKASVAASTALLDRAWGKAVQAVEHSGEITTSKVIRTPAVATSDKQWLDQHKGETLQ